MALAISRYVTNVSSAALALCVVVHSSPVRAESMRLGFDAEYLHDNNVTRGPAEDDRKSDNALSLEGYGARSLRLGARSGLVTRAALRLTEYASIGDVSHLAAAARAAYRVQPAPGYHRPWLELAASAQWLKHRDSDLRDGFVTAAGIGIGRYLTDRVRVTWNGALEKRIAPEGALYDLLQNRIWATVDYRVGTRAVMYASAARLAGDHLFNAISAQGQAWLSPYAEVSAADPALAEAFGGIAPTAYRIDATTLIYELGFNLPLRGNQAIDLSASYFDAEADDGPGRYDGAALRVAYLYRFR